MNLQNRQQVLAIAAAAIVALLAGDKWVLTPLIGSWKARSERLVDLKKKVSDGTDKLKVETATRLRWQTMRSNALSNNLSQARLQLQKAAERWSLDSKITINSIRPADKKGGDENYELVDFRVDAAGNITALTKFLYDIEKDPLALKVETVQVTARDEYGQQLQLGLLVNGLVLNPPKANTTSKKR